MCVSASDGPKKGPRNSSATALRWVSKQPTFFQTVTSFLICALSSGAGPPVLISNDTIAHPAPLPPPQSLCDPSCLSNSPSLSPASHLQLFWGVWHELLNPAGSRTGEQRQLPFTSLPGVWKNPKILETSESFISTCLLSLFDPCCCLTKFLMRNFQNYVDICRVFPLAKLPGNLFKYSKWVI